MVVKRVWYEFKGKSSVTLKRRLGSGAFVLVGVNAKIIVNNVATMIRFMI